jgi:lysophospholipase L1-like esterase
MSSTPAQPAESSKPGREGPRRASKLALAGAITLALALIGLELAARFMPLAAFDLDTLDPMREVQRHRYRPHPYATMTPRPSWGTPPERKLRATHNTLGFRGPETTWAKPEGRLRVLCVGGSSTYGYTVSSNETTYPARLQHYLGLLRPEADIEVINSGVPGYTTFESLTNLATRAIALEPDIVIVYHGINDAQAALYRSAKHPDAPVQPDNTHYRSNWRVPLKGSFETFLERSRAFLVLRRYLTNYAEVQSQLNSALVVDFVPGRKDLFANPDPSPVGFSNFERNLESIFAIARTHGAQVLFATQAIDIDDFDRDPPVAAAAQKAAVRRNQELVRQVAQRWKVQLVDLAPELEAFAAERRGRGLDDVFTETVHFTDFGADKLAQLVAKGLVDSGYLP